MTDLKSIARAMGGEVNGKLACFPTPGHSKRDRGSTAELVASAPDGVLIRSYNGGDPLAIKDELRAKGVLPERETRQSGNDNGNGSGWRCTGTYEYDDGAGQVIYRTRRLERTGSKKRFVAERLEGGTWVSGLGDVDRLPYRFTDLCQAAERARAAGDPEPLIYFAEGERKADKLASWGFLATAIAFGCKGWREEYAEAFRRATVIILPDNDDPGRQFAATVKASIEEYGGTAHVIELPGLPAGGDIVDWTGTADDLRALTDKALGGSLLPLPTLDLAELATQRAKAKRFAIEQLAPEGEVTLGTGPGAGGKSLLSQQLATAGAAGLPCLGLNVQPGPTLYLTCEDSAEQLHWRQEHMCASMGVDMASLAGRLHLVSLRGALDNELCTFTAEGALKPAPAYHRLVAMVQATGAKLVFLDNVAHLYPDNENDRAKVTRFVNLLNRLAGETGAAIVLLGHPNKSGDSYSGSTAWLNAVRSQFTIDHDRDADGTILDPDARVLSVGKANYARKGDLLRFRWHEWAYVLEDDLPTDTRAELAETIKANGENAAFMACLQARAAQGEGREVGPSPGPNYAPAQFEGMPQAKGYRKAALKRAMDRLFMIGRIEAVTIERPGKSARKTILREVPEGSPNAFPNASRTPFPNVPEPPPEHSPEHTLDTTYQTGAAHWPAAPDDDDLDWGEEAAE